jgi:hypothetical protein
MDALFQLLTIWKMGLAILPIKIERLRLPRLPPFTIHFIEHQLPVFFRPKAERRFTC